MKKFNKIISLLLALVMVVGMLPGTALAVVGSEDQQKPGVSVVSGNPAQGSVLTNDGVTITKVENPGYDLTINGTQAEKLESTVEYSDNEMVDVIVVMDDKPLLKYGYSTGEISANGASVSRRVATLREKQDDLVTRINRVVSSGASTFGIQGKAPEVTVQYYYNVILSGLAIKVPYGALEEIKSLAGVQDAFVAPVFSVPEDMSTADTEVQPSMYATKNSFGSALTWEELGYTGAGMRIAILDTGLDTDHPSFAADPELTEDSLTLAEIERVLPELNAAQWYEYDHGTPLTAGDVYRSAKIPFAYNYGYNNLNVDHNDLPNDHGTHVAGIAAANKVEDSDVVGVAPDAQVIVLKVFNENGGASSIDIVAAMEDAFRLNVDVMNLSLGSDAGFTQMNDLFNTILDSDMIVSISAGNSYSSAYGNWYGTNTNMTSDPDNGLVGWPGTMIGATTVASLENDYVMADYLAMADGTAIFYQDSIEGLYAAAGYPDYYGAAYMKMLVDNGEMDYVIIDGLGEAEYFYDEEGNSLVAGKIAVIKRGTLSFSEKIFNAETAGAVGVIIWNNNDTDDIFSFGMTTAGEDGSFPSIPSCIVLQSAGQKLADAEVKTISVAEDKAANMSSNAGLMSDFSSWGAAPDLRLVPSVTAPGGNIYSSVDPAISGVGSYYATMSGTSMSAPHIAGMSALVLQYLRDKYDLTDAEAHTIAEALIMSTAVPVLETSGAPYSPRKQGAGSANVYSAIASSGYLTVEGNPGKQPSVSIGDDDAKTGVYSFEFTINNLSAEDQSYTLDATVLTDYVDTSMAAYGYLFMGETSLPLDASVEFTVASGSDADSILYDADGDGDLDVNDVQYLLDCVNGISGKTASEDQYDLNGDGVLNTADVQLVNEYLLSLPVTTLDEIVVVPAKGNVTVTVEITLSDDDKEYMDYFYPNGIYVDGFVRCYSMSEDADLSLPFLAFYGDWSEAGDVFDTGWWYELYAGDGYSEYNRYPNMFWTNYGSSDYLLGLNPYINEVYDPAHNVLSPNGDGYFDMVNEIYFGMMRNAMYLDFNWVDGDGNVLFNRTAEGVRKSVYNYSYDICYPFVYSDYIYQVDGDGYPILDENEYTIADIYDLTDLKNNTELALVVDAYLDDGDLDADQTLTFPMVIDTEAPELVGSQLIYDEKTDTRTLRLFVSDNYDIAALMPLTMVGVPYEYFPVTAKEAGDVGEATVIDLDVSSYDSTFYIVLGDYGGNESWYEIEFEGEANIDFGKFYGYRRYSALPYPNYPGYYYVTSGYNGWVSFTESDAMLNHTYTYGNDGSELEATVAAAEYIDGYIFGVDVNGEIFVMKSGDWTRIHLGNMPEGRDANYDYVPYPALDMTYDYVSGNLYILTDELVAGDGGHLMTLNYFTGEVTDLGIVTTADGSQPLTLACDNDGILYTIDLMSGALYTIDPANTETIEPDNWWEDPVTYIRATYVGATGYLPAYVQSMTVDHETNELYWLAYCGAMEGYSYLFRVDKSTGRLTVMVPSNYDGTDFPVEYNCEMVALIKPFDFIDLIPDADLESLVISDESLVLNVGGEDSLVVTPYPYNADIGELTWTSSDETVAVVIDGVVYAVGAGRAVITVSNGTQSVECMVDVVNLTSDLTFYDMGNTYYWGTLNVANPGAAEYLWDATVPYNGVYAAAYFDGYVYASESTGSFYRLDAETMQGVQIGSTGNPLLALAFNYTDGFMYGVEMEQAGMWQSYFHIVRVNLGTGELERIATFGEDYTPLAFMSVDYDGNFYSICGNNWTYGVELVKWTRTDEGMTVLKSWDISETAYNVNNYTSMTYSAQDNGIFFTDGTGMLFWIDAASLTDESESPRIVSLGYVGEPTGYAVNMGMFTIPDPEPSIPDVEVTGVYVPESYLLLEGGSVSAGVTVEPWNAYPEITYSVENEDIATVDSEGSITGVSCGETTLTVTVDDTPHTATVTVCASAGMLNGYLLSDFVYGGNLWVDFSDADPANDYESLAEEYSLAVFSGAYFDGKIYVYGQDQYNDYKNYFGVVDAETFELEIGAKINYTLRDMAFDYTTGNLYAIAEGGIVIGAVAQVNPETGEVTIVADTGKTFAAMTIDGNGQMYGIGEDDILYAIDKETGALTLVGYTGADAGALFQSMHYDLETGNTYWAQVADNGANSSLRLVDLTTGSSTKLGTITPAGCEIVALYTVPSNEPTEPDEETVEIADIKLPETATVVVGNTVELTATVLAAVELKPSNIQTFGVQTPNPFIPVENVTVTWTSADESIATVNGNGVVTGVAAGTVEITASVGDDVSAVCTVTVTASERLFYAYDELNHQWVSFSGQNTADVTVVRSDSEDEAPIQAAYYTGETIYAYDVDGKFYTLDPETLERTLVAEGLKGQTIEIEYEYYDWWTGMSAIIPIDCFARVLDLSYDNGKLYAAVCLYDYEYGVQLYPICEVNLETGMLEILYLSYDIKPSNLLVQDGIAFYVDGYMSGMLSCVNLNDAEPTYSQYALIQGYWGYPEASRSLYLDTLTGTVYAFRDFTDPEYDDDWNEVYLSGAATLCTLNLGDADIAELGLVGTGLLLNSLFIR